MKAMNTKTTNTTNKKFGIWCLTTKSFTKHVFSTAKRAATKADKLDMEIGGYRFIVKEIN